MMQLAIAIAALTTFPVEGFAATSQKQDALPKGLIHRNSNGDSDTLTQGSAVPAPTYGLMRGKKNKKDVQLHIDENGDQKIGSEAGTKQDTKEESLIQKIQDTPAKKEEAKIEEAQTGTEDSECEDFAAKDFGHLSFGSRLSLGSARREWCNRMKEASADLRTQLEVSDCQDDCDWYKNGDKDKKCAWIKKNPQHCLRMRSGGRKVLAADACCDACKCTKVLQELDCEQYKDAKIYDSITDKDLISNTNYWYKDMSIGEFGFDKIDQTVEKLLGDLSSHLKSKSKSELEEAGRDATIMKRFWDKTSGIQDSEDCDSGETCARALYIKADNISQCFAAMVAASRCMKEEWHEYSDGCGTTTTKSPGFAIAPAPSEGAEEAAPEESEARQYCATGIFPSKEEKRDVCCPKSCGECGEIGCAKRPGGKDKCCVEQIRAKGNICSSETDTACNLPTTPQAAAKRCGDLCRETGFCCNDPEIGSNKLFSCSQACMVRYYAASEEECLDEVNEQANEPAETRGCTRKYKSRTFKVCSGCTDVTDTDECAHGVPDGVAAQVGCSFDVRKGKRTKKMKKKVLKNALKMKKALRAIFKKKALLQTE